MKRAVTPAQVHGLVDVACAYAGARRDLVWVNGELGRNRKPAAPATIAVHLIIWLLLDVVGTGSTRAARLLGRDHSTLHLSLRNRRAALRANPVMRLEYSQLADRVLTGMRDRVPWTVLACVEQTRRKQLSELTNVAWTEHHGAKTASREYFKRQNAQFSLAMLRALREEAGV